MSALSPIKIEYRRDLPHIQPVSGTFFVTYRLKDTLPRTIAEQFQLEKEVQYRLIRETEDARLLQRLYEEQKRQFARYDAYLDRCLSGERWLERPELARLAAKSIHFWENRLYELITYTIMPNHVHAVLDLSVQVSSPDDSQSDSLVGSTENYRQLFHVLKSVKNFSARECNEHLNRQGSFWQKESYDHLVRDSQELDRIITYVIENPVKAGLVNDWREWPFTYLNPNYSGN